MRYTPRPDRRFASAIRTTAAGLALLAGPTAVTVFGVAEPAAADVNLTPSQATQGDPMEIVFKISNSKPAANITKVEIRMPDDPIAEVYPMSVPDWAPGLAYRTLDKPITGVHGFDTNSVVTAVTWTTMPGKDLAPGRSSDLKLSIGPMPQTAQAAFGVVETYSDGTTVSYTGQPGAAPAPSMQLRPGTGGTDHQDATGDATGNGTGDGTAADAPAAATTPAKGGTGPTNGWWLLSAALILGVVIAFVLIRPRLSASSDALTAAGKPTPKSTSKATAKSIRKAPPKAKLTPIRASKPRPELQRTGRSR